MFLACCGTLGEVLLLSGYAELASEEEEAPGALFPVTLKRSASQPCHSGLSHGSQDGD